MKKISRLLLIGIILLFSNKPARSDEFSPDSITKIMKKVAGYRLSHGVKSLGDWFASSTNWDAGAYMTGVCALYRHTNEKQYLDSIVNFGVFANWTPASGNPDNECCAQTFCESYLFAADTSKKYMYEPWLSRVTADFLSHSPSGRSYWYWCDALYMAPPGLAMLASITGQTRILDSLYKCWWDDAQVIYSDTFHLYWRDPGYKLPKVDSLGKPIFWAPGEAWVLGGQARILKYTPLNYHGRDSMITQFRDQLAAVVACQQGDGLWTTSLLDSVEFWQHETSSTAFFCFAMAWGINNGILDSAVFTPPMRRAWSGLVKNIASDGKLMYCQTVAQEPFNNMSADYSSSEGEGALLLAGEEMYKRVTGAVEVQIPKQTVETKRSIPECQLVTAITNGFIIPNNAARLEIYTIQGRKIFSATAASLNRDKTILNGYGRGMYLIRYFK
ncbi:MAG TPA: glycoside hydrolase family 88 protein [Chitinivibrionales bacterium]|nr:glycoside hydrolase family 88 protein [Chitinivibrionales bacterium]